MSTVTDPAAAVKDLLRRHRWAILTESHVQDGIADLMHDAGIDFAREVRLSGRDRIDFLVADTLGLEVKVAGQPAPVLTQLSRYASHDRIGSLLLVTTKAKHCALPMMVGGKPLHVQLLRGAG